MATLTRCPNRTDCGYYTIVGRVYREVDSVYKRGPKAGQPRLEKRGGKLVPKKEAIFCSYDIAPRGEFESISLSNDIEMSIGSRSTSWRSLILVCPCCGVVFYEPRQTSDFDEVHDDIWKKNTLDELEKTIRENSY